MRFFAAIAAFVLCASSALAQQPEQIAVNVYVRGGTPCVVTGQANTPSTGGATTGNQILFLENFTDGLLPNPAYITGTEVWIDGVDPIPSNTYGNLTFAVDPQQRWSIEADFPDKQKAEIYDLKRVGLLQVFPHGLQHAATSFDPPVAYRSGDGIVSAPECNSGASPLPNFETYLTVFVKGSADFLSTQPTNLVNIKTGMPSANNPPIHLRSLIPGPTVAASKIRVKIRSNWQQSSPVAVTHLVVGLQNGSGPDMQAVPVVLTFQGKAAPLALGAAGWVWSDWVPLAIPAGQNIIVGASLWSAGSTNSWDYIATGGFGAWASTSADSWSSNVMLGTITAQPGFMQVVSQVQVQ